MKRIYTFFLCIFCFNQLHAQHISPQNLKELLAREDSMKMHAPVILVGTTGADRLTADSVFTRQLVRALRVPYSFEYPFDSLFTISRMYAPDSSFRVFTWQLEVNEDLVRQHGAIQMRTTDGSLKLFPLIDKSDEIPGLEDSISNHQNWMGAVYYRILMNKVRGRKIYTLIGFDDNNSSSSKKIIEILEFVNKEPRFGARVFRYPNNELNASNPARYVMEFKKDAGPRLNYDEEMNLIIIEHLVSQSGEPNKKSTLVGDGDYDGFKWANGKWVFVNKIFKDITPEGKEPVPMPIRDAKGNIDDSKLKQEN